MLQAHLIETLGLGSLDAVEPAVAFEDEFCLYDQRCFSLLSISASLVVMLCIACMCVLGSARVLSAHLSSLSCSFPIHSNRGAGLVISDADAVTLLSGEKAVKYLVASRDKISAN